MNSDNPPASEGPARHEVPGSVVRELSASAHKLWGDWVDGAIPGFPDDDCALLDARAADSAAIRTRHGV
jgi:hypothetical protein